MEGRAGDEMVWIMLSVVCKLFIHHRIIVGWYRVSFSYLLQVC